MTPNDIQSARVNVLSNEICYERIISPLLNDHWHFHGRMPTIEDFEFEQQWCSFGDDGERSCHGDSGGPVVCLQGQIVFNSQAPVSLELPSQRRKNRTFFHIF